jgi:hypothetical protein
LSITLSVTAISMQMESMTQAFADTGAIVRYPFIFLTKG